MVELWAVIVLIVSVVMTFAGAFMALTAVSLRKPVDALHTRVDDHSQRLQELERMGVRLESQYDSVILGIGDLKRILEKHVDKGH